MFFQHYIPVLEEYCFRFYVDATHLQQRRYQLGVTFGAHLKCFRFINFLFTVLLLTFWSTSKSCEKIERVTNNARN